MGIDALRLVLFGKGTLEGGREITFEPKQAAAFQAEADTAIAELKGEVSKTDAVVEITPVEIAPEVK